MDVSKPKPDTKFSQLSVDDSDVACSQASASPEQSWNEQSWNEHTVTALSEHQQRDITYMLPNEMWSKIFACSPFKDWFKIGRTCQKFRAIININYQAWGRQMVNLYPEIASSKGSFKDNPCLIKLLAERQFIPAYVTIGNAKLQMALARHYNYFPANLTATLEGHKDSVQDVIVLDDDRLVSASSDNTLKVWDLTRSQKSCVATLDGHEKGLICVRSMPGGQLVSASRDHTVRVWDISKPQGHECVHILRGHGEPVSDVAVLSDRLLVSVSYDKQLKVWDLECPQEDKCIAGFEETNLLCRVTALSADRFVSFPLWKNKHPGRPPAKVWDIINHRDLQCTAKLEEHTGNLINSVTALKDSRFIASTSDDKTIRIYDLNKPAGQQCIDVLEGHSGRVNWVGQLEDERLVSVSVDQSVRVWDLSQPKGEQCVFNGIHHSADSVEDAVLLPDGRVLTITNPVYQSCFNGEDIFGPERVLYDFSGFELQITPISSQWHSGYIADVKFLSDGRMVTSADSDKKIKIWDYGDVSLGFRTSKITGYRRV